jgi:gentisate 1,2-dioxygenase
MKGCDDDSATIQRYLGRKLKISLLVSSTRYAVAAGREEVFSCGIVFHYSKQASFNVTTWNTHGLTYSRIIIA